MTFSQKSRGIICKEIKVWYHHGGRQKSRCGTIMGEGRNQGVDSITGEGRNQGVVPSWGKAEIKGNIVMARIKFYMAGNAIASVLLVA